ncbi:MAG: response regulator transcription factor [Bacteriovoracales bacterium]
MTKKILIAEDSQTVQKVIGFTLENEPFEPVSCKDEKSLFSQLEESDFDLVALDMSLSEKKSGYDLVREIKLRHPKVSVLALFGTFDVIDEKALKNSGADERVIKPFDSVEFITKCKKLTKISEMVPEIEPEIIPQTEFDSEEWKLEAPIADNTEKFEEPVLDFDSWGMDIPGIIETPMVPDESLLEEGAKILDNLNKAQESEDDLLSFEEEELESKDLEFPEEIIGKSLAKNIVEEKTFEPEEIQEVSFNFESAIDEAITPEEFWAVDNESIPKELPSNKKIAPALKKPSAIGADQNLISELMEGLKPFIEEQIKKYCQQTAEKVAWEVIPDLAENLIKKEIKEISSSLD